jgi:hypothetical protein
VADLRFKGAEEMNDEDKKTRADNEEVTADSSAHGEHDRQSGKEEKPAGEEKLSEEQIAEIGKTRI